MKWRAGQPLSLRTGRFTLRSLEPDDATETAAGWISNPEIMAFVRPAAGTVSVAMLREQIRGHDNSKRFLLGIFTGEEERLVGMYWVYVDMPNRSAQTNVVIGDTAFWGKKVVLETRTALLDFLFDRLGMEKIWGVPFARNLPAVFNYKAQGFTCEGVMRQNVRLKDGSRLDQYHFGLLREEWRARRAKKRESGAGGDAGPPGEAPVGEGGGT